MAGREEVVSGSIGTFLGNQERLGLSNLTCRLWIGQLRALQKLRALLEEHG